MKIFNLPKSTEFGRVIPKNAFDKHTNTKQKKEMSTFIQRITWSNKLSTETTNLPKKVINEVQVFTIELKIKNDLKQTLVIINRAIPYHLVFVLQYQDEILISTAVKHNHLQKLNETVIDCTFQTDWFKASKNSIELILSESLDFTFIHLCNQISGRKKMYKNYSDFVSTEVEKSDFLSRINYLQRQIKSEKQFNKKVELNMELIKLQQELSAMD
jgi:REP element-mobilizing transposase RayT